MDPQTPAGTVRVTFLGDTLVGGVGQEVLDEKGPDWAFDGIRPLLEGSDLVVANHEGPITSHHEPEEKLDTGRKRYWYRALPSSVSALVGAGIRVVSLANNHVLDFGARGLADTIEALDEAGIAHCGAGADRRHARRPAIVEVGSLRFGFLSFLQRYGIYAAENLYASKDRSGPMRLSLRRAQADLARLGERADVRIALAHWGRNYKKVNGRQVRLASGLVAGGADIVIGHHPHVPHPISIVDGTPVFYSLGNGPLGTPGRFHSGRRPYGLVVSLDFDETASIRRIGIAAIRVDNAVVNFRPEIAEKQETRDLLKKLLPAEPGWKQQADGVFSAELDVRPRPTSGVTPLLQAQRRATASAKSTSQASRASSSSAT